MVWAIDSTPIFKGQFYQLKIRFLLSYLGLMITIVGTTSLVVYQFVAYRLNQEFEHDILLVAESVAPTLEIIKHEYQEFYNNQVVMPMTLAELMKQSQEKKLENYTNFKLEKNQGIEWFNEEGKLLIKQGNFLPNSSLLKLHNPSKFYEKQNHIFTIILPVYGITFHKHQHLIGYIRVSNSTSKLEADLKLLRWGLGLGGLVALVLSTCSAIILARESIKPIATNFEKLKQFTADASHELRTPLTVIKTSVDVILSHPDRINAQDVQKIKAIAEATTQMTSLVEDLLLLARFDRSNTNVQKKYIPIPIDEIWEDLLDFAQIKAQTKQITLQSHLVSNLLVKGDAIYLQRLFSNLLHNALQYTTQGGNIKVSLQKNPPYAVITIEDTGIGIAKDDLDKIFARFWRGEEGRLYRPDGTGLGLAIAQIIVNSHGGKITVSSELGVGSCFSVYLPLCLP